MDLRISIRLTTFSTVYWRILKNDPEITTQAKEALAEIKQMKKNLINN